MRCVTKIDYLSDGVDVDPELYDKKLLHEWKGPFNDPESDTSLANSTRYIFNLLHF